MVSLILSRDNGLVPIKTADGADNIPILALMRPWVAKIYCSTINLNYFIIPYNPVTGSKNNKFSRGKYESVLKTIIAMIIKTKLKVLYFEKSLCQFKIL